MHQRLALGDALNLTALDELQSGACTVCLRGKG